MPMVLQRPYESFSRWEMDPLITPVSDGIMTELTEVVLRIQDNTGSCQAPLRVTSLLVQIHMSVTTQPSWVFTTRTILV